MIPLLCVSLMKESFRSAIVGLGLDVVSSDGSIVFN